MNDKVYLVWQSYISKELLVIGCLKKNDAKSYSFKFDEEAIKAKQLGCFLPFDYTKDELCFDSLPFFFNQRILRNKYYINRFGIDYDDLDEFGLLTYGNGVKNNDNFSVISEKNYNSLRGIEEFNDKKYSVRK